MFSLIIIPFKYSVGVIVQHFTVFVRSVVQKQLTMISLKHSGDNISWAPNKLSLCKLDATEFSSKRRYVQYVSTFRG